MKLPVVMFRYRLLLISWLLLCVALSGCSTSPKPKPRDLGANLPSLNASLKWQASAGTLLSPQVLTVKNDRLALVTAKGEVRVHDLIKGSLLWSFDARAPVDSGAGFDGVRVAVVTQTNQLVVIQSGRLAWQVRLPARSFTPPLLAGGRVFVLLADRSVMALDGETGGVIWHLTEDTDPLVLQQAGLLTHTDNRLLVGQGARLLRINPDDGAVEMQTTLAVARGVNDLERLIDLIAPAALNPGRLCVVAFQTQLACVNPATGALLWSRATTSVVGVSADQSALVNVQENGVIRLWNVQANQMNWDSEMLKFRELRTPSLTPTQVVVADETGTLYALDRKDGALKGRVVTGLGALAADPVMLPQGLLLIGRSGQIRLYQSL